jgi:uncharacterized protein YndB with AHSA1/START domain
MGRSETEEGGGRMSATATETMKGYALEITRVFDAPRELVWKAWTDPEMVKQWKGPRGFQVLEYESSHEPGGRWRMTMEGQRPGSEEKARLAQHGVVKEFRPPELLVFTFAWDDRSCVGLPASPFKENIVTIRLEERGGKTVMHFTQAPFATESERDGHGGGWNSSFDRFAEFMLAEQPGRASAVDDVPSELHLRRFFKAPRQLVFDAWTEAEMMKQWWGPKCFTNPVCEVDARGGGAIRIHMRGPDGMVYPMEGRFVEFYPPHRFHFTSSPLDKDGNAVFETWTSVFFDEVNGGTEVVLDVHVTKSTPQAAPYLKGMNAGWNQSLDRLEDFVEKQTGER